MHPTIRTPGGSDNKQMEQLKEFEQATDTQS